MDGLQRGPRGRRGRPVGEDDLVAVLEDDGVPRLLMGLRARLGKYDFIAVATGDRAPPRVPHSLAINRRSGAQLGRRAVSHGLRGRDRHVHGRGRGRGAGVARGHVGGDDEAAALNGDGAHQREPGVATIGGGREVEVHVLGVERLAEERHVVLPADGGGEVDAGAADVGRHGAEGRGGPLGPDEALGAGLVWLSFCSRAGGGG